MNGIAERLTELVDDRRRNVELARRIRIYLLANLLVGASLGHDFLLEHANPIKKSFRARRASGNVDIDGDDRVDSLHHRVVVEHSARGCARSHRNAPLRLWHLLPDSAKHRGELEWNASGADQYVSLPRREAHSLHAESREVEAGSRGRHEFDRAACSSERHGPERVGPPPVHEKVEPRSYPAFLALRLVGDGAVFWSSGQSHCSAPFFQT